MLPISIVCGTLIEYGKNSSGKLELLVRVYLKYGLSSEAICLQEEVCVAT